MKKIAIFVAIVLSVGLCISCRNSSNTKLFVDKAVKEYRAASKSDAVRYLKTQNRINQAERLIDNYYSSSSCSTCNGYGVVYQVDAYGNVITDYYGNTIYYFCPTCGGSGNY
ncbi:MAG: hypothetical protein IJE18_08565 [Bacteroidaceae bacterium]|nr:hypothetical protein [Bacteroidaceae bacterium]